MIEICFKKFFQIIRVMRIKFVQFSFETNDEKFVFLDTKKQGKNMHDDELCDKRLAWLKMQLINSGNK